MMQCLCDIKNINAQYHSGTLHYFLSENAFPVDIDTNKLWKVDISFEENKKLELVNTKINANIKEDLGSEELSPLSKISKHFTFQPADISSYSVLLRRRKFTAPQRMVSRLRTCFTFPDGTEDEHIVINRECVIGKEIVCLVDDEDLASIIWTQGFKIDLPIVVDTSQQPFFVVDKSRRYSDIGARFGMKHKTCIHVTSANEATRREFISSVLHGVASCYDGEVKVCPEYELSGSHGKGPVDWVIKIGDTIIVVTDPITCFVPA
ncbi:uncharacterized protein OCT59_002534 [Rhizophagus irregularis]|uniref:uncharacterized protein n=1 Tax=Rhizophagus irregularis TaxID=588596 RepID=UPI003326AC72|nr:hypothetical protein OCT59_002534 [Rhizophagus irregularis]